MKRVFGRPISEFVPTELFDLFNTTSCGRVVPQSKPYPMAHEDSCYDFVHKFLLIGESKVGKTALSYRIVHDKFLEPFISTIGIDFSFKILKLHGYTEKTQIWDTAGHERFRTFNDGYYRGIQGIFIVFDLTNKESFENLQYWVARTKKLTSLNINQILLVGNKADLEESRVISYDEGFQFAKKVGISYIETSAKTG